MKRKIVSINEDKCTGCGLCIEACHEGALQLVNGKARLVSDAYCDGLGDCLPECPAGAITIEEREAAPYDEIAVKEQRGEDQAVVNTANCTFQCPGVKSQKITRESDSPYFAENKRQAQKSELSQWPCQIKLVSPHAAYLKNARLLIAADCTAYAYAGIHHDFIKGKITLIGCPKLDAVDYAEKLTEILKSNGIESVTVLKMEVPCCLGIVNAVKTALAEAAADGKIIPWQVYTVSINGELSEG